MEIGKFWKLEAQFNMSNVQTKKFPGRIGKKDGERGGPYRKKEIENELAAGKILWDVRSLMGFRVQGCGEQDWWQSVASFGIKGKI